MVKFASILFIIWWAGFFGLFPNEATGATNGGFVGDTLNSAMLAMVEPGVAGFIYILLIMLTTLFALRITPAAILDS